MIEAPYRNTKLAEQILASCGAQTRLTIACDITSANEYIRTATIAEWRKEGVPDINKRPTIFILGA
jgi:16S rRNA (cytidine1402-2'-O)-methyltransferase